MFLLDWGFPPAQIVFGIDPSTVYRSAAVYEQAADLGDCLHKKCLRGWTSVICDDVRYYHSRAVKALPATSRVEQVFLPS